jgi:hypothetical protein
VSVENGGKAAGRDLYTPNRAGVRKLPIDLVQSKTHVYIILP